MRSPHSIRYRRMLQRLKEARLQAHLTQAEVAAALRIPVGTAKSRLHYALAAMRRTVTASSDAPAQAVVGGQLA